MKRNLGARIATAVALAGIGAALTACGSNNNNAAPACIPTAYGTCTAAGLGGTIISGAGFTMGFSGTAVVEGDGLYAGSSLGLPLTMTPQPGSIAQPPLGQYQYGNIGPDGTILAFNLTQIGPTQYQITGVLSLSQLQYGAMAPYITSAPQLTIYNVAQMPMAEAQQTLGGSLGNQPFQYLAWSGQVLLNGNIPVNPY